MDFFVKDFAHLKAVHILQGNEIVFQELKNYKEDDLFPVGCIFKSFLSALVGIAIHEGKIGSIKDRITDYYTECRYASEWDQLPRYPHLGYEVVDVKTESGERKVPMTREVADAFRRIILKRKNLKVEPIINGYSGFIFLDKSNNPNVALHWENYFRHAVTKYNTTYKAQLLKITPHVARHTFCSRMAAKRMNPKVLQQIMGHADISVTMNTYTHLEFSDAYNEMVRVSGGK